MLKENPWLPGRYENLTPEQVQAQVGTNVSNIQGAGSGTPGSMRALSDAKGRGNKTHARRFRGINL